MRCVLGVFQVTLLLSYFSDAELADQSADRQRYLDFINMYNRRFSGQPLTVSYLLISGKHRTMGSGVL